MSNEFPKTVIIGLSRAGDELEQRIPHNTCAEARDWSFVQTAYYLYENGSRGDIDQWAIDSFNDEIKLDIEKGKQETSETEYSIAAMNQRYEDWFERLCSQHGIPTTRDAKAPREARPETQNARFDRLKAEAHERRAAENHSDLESRTAQDARAWWNGHHLAAAFDLDLPLDIPLHAGPRHGLNN